MRVPVFGLGCAGGVSGLAIAARLARGAPGQVVLLVALELCTLAFRADRGAKADVISTALFGDGAAAAVLCADAQQSSSAPAIGLYAAPVAARQREQWQLNAYRNGPSTR